MLFTKLAVVNAGFLFTLVKQKEGFCDRLAYHRGYVSRKVLNHPIGRHFNKEGHCITDMIPIPIEKVYPEGDDLLRKRREKLWIQRYDAVNFEGGNSRE